MGSLDLYGYKNSGQYLETDLEGDGFSSRIRLTTTFKPDKNTSIQLQGSYRGAENSVVNDRNAVLCAECRSLKNNPERGRNFSL